MIDLLGQEAALQVVAALTAAVSLVTIVAARASAAPPKPCWKSAGCAWRDDDPSACQRCAVYQSAHRFDLSLRDFPELGEVRRLAAVGGAD